MQEKILERFQEKRSFMMVARQLPVWQNTLIGFTAWFWLISIVEDISVVIGYHSFEVYYLGGFIFLLLLFAIGFLMPLSFALWGIEQIYSYLKNRKPEVPFYNHVFAF